MTRLWDTRAFSDAAGSDRAARLAAWSRIGLGGFWGSARAWPRKRCASGPRRQPHLLPRRTMQRLRFRAPPHRPQRQLCRQRSKLHPRLQSRRAADALRVALDVLGPRYGGHSLTPRVFLRCRSPAFFSRFSLLFSRCIPGSCTRPWVGAITISQCMWRSRRFLHGSR